MTNIFINRFFSSPSRISSKTMRIFKLNFYQKNIKVKKEELKAISQIEPYDKDLFLDIFPYVTVEQKKTNSKLPIIFFEKEYINHYLTTLLTQSPVKEKNSYLSVLESLNFFGKLKQKEDKSIYLEFENNFLSFFDDYLNKRDAKKTSNPHLEIISRKEMENGFIFKILEIDESFKFKVKGFYSIISEEEDHKRIWFLEIESKDLEDLRFKYGLSSKKNFHNFFIVLGERQSITTKKRYPKMMINFSIFAA